MKGHSSDSASGYELPEKLIVDALNNGLSSAKHVLTIFVIMSALGSTIGLCLAVTTALPEFLRWLIAAAASGAISFFWRWAILDFVKNFWLSTTGKKLVRIAIIICIGYGIFWSSTLWMSSILGSSEAQQAHKRHYLNQITTTSDSLYEAGNRQTDLIEKELTGYAIYFESLSRAEANNGSTTGNSGKKWVANKYYNLAVRFESKAREFGQANTEAETALAAIHELARTGLMVTDSDTNFLEQRASINLEFVKLNNAIFSSTQRVGSFLENLDQETSLNDTSDISESSRAGLKRISVLIDSVANNFGQAAEQDTALIPEFVPVKPPIFNKISDHKAVRVYWREVPFAWAFGGLFDGGVLLIAISLIINIRTKMEGAVFLGLYQEAELLKTGIIDQLKTDSQEVADAFALEIETKVEQGVSKVNKKLTELNALAAQLSMEHKR